jgi:outer membrane lipoprotein-sorting protein
MSSIAVMVGVGAAVVAGGAVAAGAMQSDATNRANRSSSAATKKYMKLASAEAERGYSDIMAAVQGLQKAQPKLSGEYMDRTGKMLDTYGREVNKALGNFPDYYTGWSQVVDQANQNVADYEERSRNVIKDSADQTYDYNLSRFDDFNNFARKISEENQKIRLDLARAATPLFDETRSQIALNDLQGTQGIMSAATESAITRAAAQRGLASGTGAGSPLKLNLELRDIGLMADQEKNAAAQRFQNRQLLDYNTLVAGTQMGVENVYNFMGLNVNKVIDINNENSAKLFDAQKLPLDYKMVGLNTALDKRFDLATNKASFLHTTYSNVYGQESDTARTVAAMAAGAAENRTNQKLGIAGQGLAGAYANANRTMASGLANAQLVSNASSTIGGSMMGYGMAKGTGGQINYGFGSNAQTIGQTA